MNGIRVCGLWKNVDKNGNEYFSGNIGDIRVMIFPNRFKETEKQPDYIMRFSERQYQKQQSEPTDEGDSDDKPAF